MGNSSDLSSEPSTGIDVDAVLQQFDNPNPNPKNIKTYIRADFRCKLVDHFDIKFNKKRAIVAYL